MIQEAKALMDDAIENYKKALATLRTGRANAAILDGIDVEYYGDRIALNQIASISVPEARQLLIKPYDKNDLKAISNAIFSSNLGLVPNSDGTVIRLNIPPLTEERRREIVRQGRKYCEECKVNIRNTRRDYMSIIKEDEESSEDYLKRLEKELQDVTDEACKRIETLMQEKEKEIMAI